MNNNKLISDLINNLAGIYQIKSIEASGNKLATSNYIIKLLFGENRLVIAEFNYHARLVSLKVGDGEIHLSEILALKYLISFSGEL